MQEHELLHKRELARLHDQLRLQLSLAWADLRDQWEGLEKKWLLLHSQLCLLEASEDEGRREVAQTFRRLLEPFAKTRNVGLGSLDLHEDRT